MQNREGRILSVDLPPAAGWREARLALHARLELLANGARILAEASAMKCLYRTTPIDRTTDDGRRWIPSAQFPTLLSAFEEGMKCTLA